MNDIIRSSQLPCPKDERRRFRRYAWKIRAELKISDQTSFEGSLLNVSRGGAMLETEEPLFGGNLLKLRVGAERGSRGEKIVLIGRTLWTSGGPEARSRHGAVFLGGQEASCKRLMHFREVSQTKSLAAALGLMFIDLGPSMVEKRALCYIKRDLAFSLNCVPIKLRGKRLMVAIADPRDENKLKRLELFSDCKIVPIVATTSAIRDTLIHFWGREFVPSENDSLDFIILNTQRKRTNPRTLAVASSASNLSAKCLATDLVAVLNRDERRARLAELHAEGLVFSDGVSKTQAEKSEWMILVLPMDKSTSSLDWAIRADETLLIVSPSHWYKGCLYIRILFDRFVETQCALSKKRLLELSIACVGISGMLEGLKTFGRIEKWVQQELDMREPGVDIRLRYLGGIVADEKSLRMAENAAVPITVLNPHSPAARCMVHIVKSLLVSPNARDPRVSLGGTFSARRPVRGKRWKSYLAKIPTRAVLVALGLCFVSVFLVSESGRDFGSNMFVFWSMEPREKVDSIRQRPHPGDVGPIESDTIHKGPQILQSEGTKGLESKSSLEERAEIPPQSTIEVRTASMGENLVVKSHPMVVQQSAIALAIEDREPKDIRSRISTRHGRVYCWVRVVGGEGRKVILRWIRNGKNLAETHLPIGSNNWRTWAHMTLKPSLIGPIEVHILDDSGELLKTESFETVIERQKEQRDTLPQTNRIGKEPLPHRTRWRSRPREP
jgi:hypothetical protein